MWVVRGPGEAIVRSEGVRVNGCVLSEGEGVRVCVSSEGVHLEGVKFYSASPTVSIPLWYNRLLT